MYLVVICVAALVVSAPIFAALIVAVASRREDRNWSLDQPPLGPVELIARRIVAFNADSIVWPRSKAQVLAEADRRRMAPEPAEEEAERDTRDAA
jgi:hypothetical protein